ncbi:MAG: Protein translocase subunit SecA [Candidatus Jorgensenbacteria bacterium GW2011_GWC1_48_8]|uniref:Protein translocase subunit SecA n=1 Tax=Candidatus Jorgensenbacteria bacterium GW2011_GWC1_48_8 TaxID=1618666 RepID=A0A0G1UV93_9BACT|nr:MAG: Protein translocase subunit SecA [Candidatus Jorgensenbacteria bacterium GW2011_GWC1_48_8]
MKFLEKFLGDPNQKIMQQLSKKVVEVNNWESQISALSDEALRAKTDEFKERLGRGETVDDLLPEAFAVAREAAKRVLGERPYDVQLMGGMALHQGKIAEMRTGEGKTLAATLPVYLNALTSKGVHVITVNDYLAKRDSEWMGQIYQFLGLSVGVILHDKNTEERRASYLSDIVYGTNNEFGFDYLRDNMAPNKESLVQRELNYAIVDEVDSILIDEARTPLIISAPDEESTDYYKRFSQIVPSLSPNVDYNIDEKMRTAVLTEDGITKVEQLLGIKDIYESGDVTLAHHIEQALRAHALYKRDRDYVVKDGEVIIVDEFTGRLMIGRRYSEGLHQAIEAKEGVEVKRESRTLATITFQNYFRLYDKLAGMTGTAKTEEEEFYKIYGLEVAVIPTNQPMIRHDLNDLVYISEVAKFKAVVREIKDRYAKGQPVLVGTIAIEKSELLADMLKTEGVPHNVLNAKHHEREAEIVKDAGQKGTVTIATNMAGRGTDIKLGNGVRELGGLHILGTERHESRRIDNQLRGRAGRQGDPGSTQFFVSTDDDLMRLFGSDRLKNMMTALKVPEDLPIEHKIVSSSIEAAQKKVEGHNFDIRKHVLQYDDVMNRQREVIYGKRRQILSNDNLRDEVWQDIRAEIEGLVNFHCAGNDKTTWNIKEVIENINTIFVLPKEDEEKIRSLESPQQIITAIVQRGEELYKQKEKESSEEAWRQVERAVYLRVIDVLWMDHLDAMVRMREGIGLIGYAQKDPLSEYKQEAYTMFHRLLAAIAADVTRMIFKVRVTPSIPRSSAEMEAKRKMAMRGAEEPTGDFKDETKEVAAGQQVSRPAYQTGRSAGQQKSNVGKRSGDKIGRNDPCPCGSGLKYKKCHGK